MVTGERFAELVAVVVFELATLVVEMVVVANVVVDDFEKSTYQIQPKMLTM